MIDEAARNVIVGSVWLIAGGAIGHWFYRRREDVRQLLYGEDRDKTLSTEEADFQKVRLVFLAFACGGVWILLLFVLNWLFY